MTGSQLREFFTSPTYNLAMHLDNAFTPWRPEFCRGENRNPLNARSGVSFSEILSAPVRSLRVFCADGGGVIKFGLALSKAKVADPARLCPQR
jgi:hypothetical protein